MSSNPKLGEKTSGVRDIDPEEIARFIGPVRIIDVRELMEWTDELGHIIGAEPVPLGILAEAQRAWDRRVPIVVVCRSGRRSMRAAQQLVALGFEQVMNLRGGMLAYRAAVPSS